MKNNDLLIVVLVIVGAYMFYTATQPAGTLSPLSSLLSPNTAAQQLAAQQQQQALLLQEQQAAAQKLAQTNQTTSYVAAGTAVVSVLGDLFGDGD